MNKFAAEALGTLLLVLLGVGSAVFGIDQIGATGVALAFGFSLVALAFAFGPVSGCHINPAVTLGMLLSGRIGQRQAAGYWAAQIFGAAVAAALLWGLVKWCGIQDQTGSLGTNSWGSHINGVGAFIVEALLTFALVLVVLLVSDKARDTGLAGLPIGITLVALHLVAIPLTGTSVNPARSIGPALFAGIEPLKQLWLFIVAPLLGGLVAALARRFVAEWSGLADAEG